MGENLPFLIMCFISFARVDGGRPIEEEMRMRRPTRRTDGLMIRERRRRERERQMCNGRKIEFCPLLYSDVAPDQTFSRRRGRKEDARAGVPIERADDHPKMGPISARFLLWQPATTSLLPLFTGRRREKIGAKSQLS